MIFRVFCCAWARAGNRKFAPRPAPTAPAPVTFANCRRVRPRERFVAMMPLLPCRSLSSEGRGLDLNDEAVGGLDRGRRGLPVPEVLLVERGDLQVLPVDVVVEAAAEVPLIVRRFERRGAQVEVLPLDEGLQVGDRDVETEVHVEVVLPRHDADELL